MQQIIIGPPGTGKSLEILHKVKQASSEKTPTLLLTYNNSNIYQLSDLLNTHSVRHEVILRADLAEELTASNTRKIMKSAEVFGKSVNIHTGILIMTVNMAKKKLDFDECCKRRFSVFCDEAGLVPYKDIERYEHENIQLTLVGDDQQFGTFYNEVSAITKWKTKWPVAELTISYRLNLETVTCLQHFYPDLKAVNEFRGMKIGTETWRGIGLFKTDTKSYKNHKGSTICPWSNQIAAKISNHFSLHGIDNVILSPYSAPTVNNNIITVNASQGMTTTVTILVLTRSEMNKFVTDRRRLVVSLSRSTHLTIVLGSVTELVRQATWMDHLRLWPQAKIEYLLRQTVINKEGDIENDI